MTEYLAGQPAGTSGQEFLACNVVDSRRRSQEPEELAAAFEARYGYAPDWVFVSGVLIMAGPIKEK